MLELLAFCLLFQPSSQLYKLRYDEVFELNQFCGTVKYEMYGGKCAGLNYADIEIPFKLVDARPAKLLQCPWAVAALYRYSKTRPLHRRHFCGGTLISQRHFLTSRHCVELYKLVDMRSGKVFVGLTNFNISDPFIPARNFYKVADILPYPHTSYIDRLSQFRRFSGHNDIAIIELERNVYVPLIEQGIAVPVCLPSAPFEQYSSNDNAFCFAGFGHTLNESVGGVDLGKLHVVKQYAKRCSEMVPIYSTDLHHTTICTKSSRTLSGDCGTGLIRKPRTTEGRREIIGILSSAVFVNDGLVSVFTDVYEKLDWIKDAIFSTDL